MTGYKQPINQLDPKFYRVVLTLNGGSATYPSADSDANGAVYVCDHRGFVTVPTSPEIAKQVARGYLRFLSIVEEVTKYADGQIVDVEFTSANKNAPEFQPTQVKFTVRYDREANLLETLRSVVDSSGGTISTVEGAIRHLVVQGITRGGTSGYRRRVRVWDTVILGDSDQTVRIVQPDIPSKVFNDVAVTLIDGTSS